MTPSDPDSRPARSRGAVRPVGPNRTLGPAGTGGDPETVRVSELLAALSFALDLTEGQPFGHALRSCLIGMRLAERLDLPVQDRRDLYYAMLLKDVGCSSNAARVFELFGGDERAAKHALKRVDWTNYLMAARYAFSQAAPGAKWFDRARRLASIAGAGPKVAAEMVQARCTRGAEIVTELGFGPAPAAAVAALDEHWDGHGQPRGLRREEIPLLARIISLAQTVEVFAVIDGASEALAMARSRRGSWFDPNLVDAILDLVPTLERWCALDEWALQEAVRAIEPGEATVIAGPGTLDRIARGFAKVVDAKSPFTARHSERVAEIALDVARALGLPESELQDLGRAGLLHDLGKLSVPNVILDKPGRLSALEWETVRLHPYYTQRILDRVEGFQELAFVASSHHERLDGRGYFRGLRGAQIPVGARILAVADIFEALTAARPYRPALPYETALATMERDRGAALGGDCLEALAQVVAEAKEQKRAA